MKIKQASPIWTMLLVFFIATLLYYHISLKLSANEIIQMNDKKHDVNFTEKILVLHIDEKQAFKRNKRIKIIDEKIKLIDIQKNEILLVNEHLLPREDTLIYVIAENINEVFADEVNIFKISELPYKMQLDENEVLIIETVDENGRITMSDNQKSFFLDVGKSKNKKRIKDLKIINRKIKNVGFYDITAFKPFVETKK